MVKLILFFSKDSQILVKDIIGELYDLETHFWDAFSRFQVDARLKDLRKQLKELNFAYAQSEDWLKVLQDCQIQNLGYWSSFG